MKKRFLGIAAWFVLSALALGSLSACASTSGFGLDGSPQLINTDPDYIRTPPQVLMPEYVGTNEQVYDDGTLSGLIDLTNVSKGYVMAKCVTPTRALLRVIKGQEGQGVTNDYAMAGDGTLTTVPLSEGNGLYTLVLYSYTGDTSDTGLPIYERLITAEISVTLDSEVTPFLFPNNIVDYTPTSNCVIKSYEITEKCSDDREVVAMIYAWIADNITYDTEKAISISENGASYYTPNPDETLAAGSGICYDYASLAAAMLRANGIPTKLVKGDVSTGDGAFAYHAWNLVWLEEEGWIAVELAVNPNDWTRIDTTFAAAGGSGSISQFIGDGSNYTDMSYH